MLEPSDLRLGEGADLARTGAATRAALIGTLMLGILLLVVSIGLSIIAAERREINLRASVIAQLDTVTWQLSSRLRQIETAVYTARERVGRGHSADPWWFGEPEVGPHSLRVVVLDESGRDAGRPGTPRLVPPASLVAQPQADRWIGPWADPSDRQIMGFVIPMTQDDGRRVWIGTLFPFDLVWPQEYAGTLKRAGLLYELMRPDVASGGRVVARGEPRTMQSPVQRSIPLLHGAWRLDAAPIAGWSQPYLFAGHITLALLLAVAASVMFFELSKRPQRLCVELSEQIQRLQTGYQRLLGELKRRKEISSKISFNAARDELTGLPNRERIVDRLERALKRARGSGEHHVGVLFAGIDRFKYVNDSLGTEAGDQVLVEVARRIDQSLRPGDTLARLGGDTFAAVLYGVGCDTALAAAQRVRDALRGPIDLAGRQVYTSMSVGVAVSATGYERGGELLKQAEMAMYHVKGEGGAQCLLFDPSLRSQAADRLQLEADLHRAIEREEFILYYQPVVSLESGGIVGMEVLVRWQHPLEGLIAPGRFIGAAEETGLICQMNRWILRRAAEQAQEWRTRGVVPPEFYLSVNLSAKDFSHADLCEYVQSVIDETSTPSGAIRLEITEGMLMQNVAGSLATVERLREMRIPLLLDDFGTGYSSLSYLHRFQFDYLKIDRSFTARVVEGGTHMGIVRAILNLSGDLGLKTIAEGVEDAVHLRFLRDLGCEYGQGYYFARPAPATEAERLVLEHTSLVGAEELVRSF